MATAVPHLTMTTKPTTQPTDTPPFTIASWSHTIIQPALLITNTLALLGALIGVLGVADNGRPWSLVMLLGLFVALESYATTVWLTHPDRRLVEHSRYRAAELVFLLLLTRLFTWIVQGNWPSWQFWTTYLFEPLRLISDPYFIGAVILAYAVWYRTVTTSNLFIRLSPDLAEQAYYTTPRGERLEANLPMPIDRKALQHNFVQQFLGGAILMLFCASLTSIDFATVRSISNPLTTGIGRLGLSTGMLWALLLYFLTGFLLFSQGRLAMLEARWLSEEAIRSPGIGRNWYRRTVFILLAIGVAAAFLPVGSTFLFGQLMQALIFGVMWLLTAVTFLGSLLIYYLLALLFPLRSTNPEVPEIPKPQQPLLPPFPNEQTAPDPTMQMVFTSAFWAVVIVLSIVAVSFFIRERGLKFNSSLLRQLWQALLTWGRAWWSGVQSQVKAARQTLQTRRQAAPQTPNTKSPWRFVRLNALSPREKVRYFYLSTLKRAEKGGIPRQESETPSEFANDLRLNWPDTSPEIEDLTEAFLLARYSRQPIAETDIPPIKAKWERLKAIIRRQTQASTSAQETPLND